MLDKYNFVQVSPELYSDKPKRYIVIDREYGLYSKKDAEIICEFIRNQFHKIIHNFLEE